MSFNIAYVYDLITHLCRPEVKVIQRHVNATVRNIGQGEAMHRKHKRLQPVAVRLTTIQVIIKLSRMDTA